MALLLPLNFEVVIRNNDVFVSMDELPQVQDAPGYRIENGRFRFEVGGIVRHSATIPRQVLDMVRSRQSLLFAMIGERGVMSAVEMNRLPEGVAP